MAQLTLEAFLQLRQQVPVLDVRTPSEYRAGHIPGARSLPLFDDDARARVGTIYKQESQQLAVLEGLRDVGPRMAELAESGIAQAVDNELILYCWRGGMRSGSMAWLMGTVGLQAHTLKGGYKTWRRFSQQLFEKPWKLLVLGGYTGAGKTEMLQRLRTLGAQVLDLEDLAHHRGSAFGSFGLPPQPTTEHFENKLAEELLRLDPQRPVWVEDESRTIGRAIIPPAFYSQMYDAPAAILTADTAYRVERLVEDYGKLPTELLASAIEAITKKIGGLAARQALEALQAGDLHTTAILTLHYYDKTYQKAVEKRQYKEEIALEPVSRADAAAQLMAMEARLLSLSSAAS